MFCVCILSPISFCCEQNERCCYITCLQRYRISKRPKHRQSEALTISYPGRREATQADKERHGETGDEAAAPEAASRAGAGGASRVADGPLDVSSRCSTSPPSCRTDPTSPASEGRGGSEGRPEESRRRAPEWSRRRRRAPRSRGGWLWRPPRTALQTKVESEALLDRAQGLFSEGRMLQQILM